MSRTSVIASNLKPCINGSQRAERLKLAVRGFQLRFQQRLVVRVLTALVLLRSKQRVSECRMTCWGSLKVRHWFEPGPLQTWSPSKPELRRRLRLAIGHGQLYCAVMRQYI